MSNQQQHTCTTKDKHANGFGRNMSGTMIYNLRGDETELLPDHIYGWKEKQGLDRDNGRLTYQQQQTSASRDRMCNNQDNIKPSRCPEFLIPSVPGGNKRYEEEVSDGYRWTQDDTYLNYNHPSHTRNGVCQKTDSKQPRPEYDNGDSNIRATSQIITHAVERSETIGDSTYKCGKRSKVLKVTIENLRTVPTSGKLDIYIDMPSSLGDIPNGEYETSVTVSRTTTSNGTPYKKNLSDDFLIDSNFVTEKTSNLNQLLVPEMRPRCNSDSKIQVRKPRQMRHHDSFPSAYVNIPAELPSDVPLTSPVASPRSSPSIRRKNCTCKNLTEKLFDNKSAEGKHTLQLPEMRPRSHSDPNLDIKRRLRSRASIRRSQESLSSDSSVYDIDLPEIKVEDFSDRRKDLQKCLENESEELKKDLSDVADFMSQVSYHRQKAHTCPESDLRSHRRRKTSPAASDEERSDRASKVKNINKKLIHQQYPFVPHNLCKVHEEKCIVGKQ